MSRVVDYCEQGMRVVVQEVCSSDIPSRGVEPSGHDHRWTRVSRGVNGAELPVLTDSIKRCLVDKLRGWAT